MEKSLINQPFKFFTMLFILSACGSSDEIKVENLIPYYYHGFWYSGSGDDYLKDGDHILISDSSILEYTKSGSCWNVTELNGCGLENWNGTYRFSQVCSGDEFTNGLSIQSNQLVLLYYDFPDNNKTYREGIRNDASKLNPICPN
jgi:hypothetical protein